MKKSILLITMMITIFGCTKNVSKAPVNNQQKTFSVSNLDTIPVPKKKGVCEGCGHQ